MTDIQTPYNVIPDAAYNQDTDQIEIIGPGGEIVFSLSAMSAAILEACIGKAQTTGFMHRLKKNVETENA